MRLLLQWCIITTIVSQHASAECSAAALINKMWPMPSGPCNSGTDEIALAAEFKFVLEGRATDSPALVAAAARVEKQI